MDRTELNNALSDATLITDICALVAIGGTLTQLCADRGLPYKAINRWIADDEKRQAAYARALQIREDHAKDLIIAELIAYIKADITQAFDAEGNLLALPEMPDDVRRLVAGVKFKEVFEFDGVGRGKKLVHTGNLIEIKFWDKPRSIETFMKHLAMLVDRKQVAVTLSLADLIAGVDKQKKESSNDRNAIAQQNSDAG